jgi:hypothetical protein
MSRNGDIKGMVSEMNIAAGVSVECADGPCGLSRYVILNPADATITHVVVGEPNRVAEPRLVPIDYISASAPGLLRLKCTRAELEALPRFFTYEDSVGAGSFLTYSPGELWMGTLVAYWPIQQLITNLASSDRTARQDARQSLVNIGRPAVDALAAALAHGEVRVRWEAAKALQQMADPAIAPALVSALEDDDSGVQWIAAEGLAFLGREGVVPLLNALMTRSDSSRLRRGAHHVLRLLIDESLKKEMAPVVTALEELEPVLEVPVAAHRALVALEERSERDSAKARAVHAG